jgi:hypothetical protein
MVGGSGFQPRLPGSSRLKTAPTVQIQLPVQNDKVSILIRPDARGQRPRARETSLDLLNIGMIKA